MKKINKILTGTLLSVISVTAIGCSSTNSKLAKNIDKSMAEFVTSINNLDYVDTSKPTTEKIGKIVETNADANVMTFALKQNKLDGNHKINSKYDSMTYLNEKLSENEIENTITRPTDRNGDFSLFILSDVPFVTLTSEDNKTNLTLNLKFSTNKIEETSTEIDSKINTLILKRSILMIYVNEIYNGNVNFSDENKVAINAYVNVIRENTSFLNGNRGMVKNQLSLASDLVNDESNNDLVNYYIIKSGEALETRANKLDSTISAIDSIINIIEDNLATHSSYYNSKLSGTYESIISNLNTNQTETSEITNNSTNKEIADFILNSLKITEKSLQIANNTENNTNENNQNENRNNTENQNINNTTDENNVENQNKPNTEISNNNYMNNTNSSTKLNTTLMQNNLNNSQKSLTNSNINSNNNLNTNNEHEKINDGIQINNPSLENENISNNKNLTENKYDLNSKMLNTNSQNKDNTNENERDNQNINEQNTSIVRRVERGLNKNNSNEDTNTTNNSQLDSTENNNISNNLQNEIRKIKHGRKNRRTINDNRNSNLNRNNFSKNETSEQSEIKNENNDNNYINRINNHHYIETDRNKPIENNQPNNQTDNPDNKIQYTSSNVITDNHAVRVPYRSNSNIKR